MCAGSHCNCPAWPCARCCETSPPACAEGFVYKAPQIAAAAASVMVFPNSLFTGSFNCRWTCNTISHSGPKPLNSAKSVQHPPARRIAYAASSAGTACWNRRRASSKMDLVCKVRSRICRDVRVTNLWNVRQGCGLDRNCCGICFSCRLRSLRNPATLISRYCACWLAACTKALYAVANFCWSSKAATGSLRIRSSMIFRHKAGLSPMRLGNTLSNLPSCVSSTSRPVWMRSLCKSPSWERSRTSPSRTCARILARSPSTSAKKSRSSARMRSSSSERSWPSASTLG
mmetsp:Transcript_111829/g.312639  ORF Transcript_111829/g.312639 Transcript_111829/m.312639 type:complete len:287 (-) Transcript_111829:263-1123(-)